MKYTTDNPLRVFTAFSGIESQLLALERLKRNFPPFDYVCVGWSEIDAHAIKAHDALFPDLADRNYGDICKIDWAQVPDFDLFTYSSPCQDFSMAGLRKGGAEDSGTRSSLLWECRKAILAKKPKYTLFENVKGLLTKKMKPYFDKWLAELDSYGYTSFAKVLNAKDYQIPQNRERIFVFSVLDCDAPYYFPKAMPQTRCLRDVLEPEPVDERYYLSEKVLATFKRRNEENAAKGNGFRFEPTEGGGIGKTILSGQTRPCDNFLKVGDGEQGGGAGKD